MKHNIFLVGFMGTGKTTVAAELAKQLNYETIDLDCVIEKSSNLKVQDIFSQFGEAEFRKRETQAVASCIEMDHTVIACGGGVVLNKQNVDYMKQAGRIVLLTALPETIYNRVKNNDSRPLLKENMSVEYISEMLGKRHTVYQSCADITMDTDNKNPASIAKEIKELLNL